jgi:hypothetical protein
LSTKAGDVDLKIPKLRQGSFFPSILERRRRIDRALFAVVMEAYVHGVSTRKVDDLVAALGLESGISKSEVSRICAELDEQLGAFRSRSLAHVEFPLRIPGRHLPEGPGRPPGRLPGRGRGDRGVEDGNREVLGCAVGHSEDGAFWTEFLRSLRARGLKGVRLVISDQHLGLKKAIEAVMVGSSWQRCRVHFMRNVLARVKRTNTHMVIAAIQTIFAQPDAASVREQFDRIVGTLEGQFPDVAAMLTDAKRGPVGLLGLPRGPLAEGLVLQPAGAAPPGDQAPDRRGRGVPERPGGRTPGHRGGGRDPRRVAGGRAPLPVRDLDGPALPGREGAMAEAPNDAIESRPLAG